MPLSTREREILGLLAGGVSGAQIAETLVLSPETVRTHIRNAMAKLGATSRAQAVALAVQRREIEGPTAPSDGETATPHAAPAPPAGAALGRARARAALAAGESDVVLTALLGGLVSLYDVEGGTIFLADEDGLSLRRAAVMGEADEAGNSPAPERIAVGAGALGRAALERRAQLVHGSGAGVDLGRTTICAPMVASGKLVGVIALSTRPSRLTGRAELLLLQAFANRVGEILVSGNADDAAPLKESLERFRTAWSAASGSS
jgi:DNA-binding CsgD family transcriptional regulator